MIRYFSQDLAEQARTIADIARGEGLDFFPVVFEVVDFDQMNQIAAYGGFPQRYPHWQFGMEYERLRKQNTYGLGKIYEMVINNNPCYAYLLSDNALVDQKLVMAHVYGHCDFFKNNVWFSQTNRRMVDEMANHATHIRRHVERHGAENVERFLEICMSLENLIDPHSAFIRRVEPRRLRRDREREPEEQAVRYPAKEYMDRYINPPQAIAAERERMKARKQQEKKATPPKPERDVLLFVLHHAPLEDWEADILAIVREEAYYYAPQAQTKIMNEGWAVYWHSRIMTQHCLRDDEVITYCDHHSGTLATAPGRVNPYKLGVELFRDIEDRWDRGRFGKEYEECADLQKRRTWNTHLDQGRDQIFEVRRVHNDVTFIDEFLTPEFVERHRLYHYRYDPASQRMVVVNRDFDKIKKQLLFSLTNSGQPYIYVVDSNYANRGELYLAHQYNGVDLDIRHATETLGNLAILWSRPVRLHTRIDGEPVLFSHDGQKSTQQKVTDDLPPPAHQIT
jgi:stage V sporulation protein R